MIESTRTSLFAQMQARLDWLDRRQGVLAQNIANADTPGYRPQDLKAFDSNALNSGGHACSGDTTAYYGGESRQRRDRQRFRQTASLTGARR
ncbi:flagellar basal body rod protein FlgB [Defluviicoccus vanus]|uniref:Flagellar basal body rod protein N-terminal domain-containing protein n=1 Tax=Defluviicoccus vanus TaxID=111831 RepID=A0A7H1MXD2_9PROT|nr:flagellar basal body protein [Defluviicoccus vanus]QNT68118.1 hypothetical protein HQ394_00530 [Defluviicoccus vanus]